MASSKPYSYRFPYDIQSTLEPWRTELGKNYDQVIATLRDRDRDLEDYLSLGVAQGQLGIATQTTSPFLFPGARTDIPGMTITVTLPANRLIKVSATVHVDVAAGATPSSFLYLTEDTVIIAQEFYNHQSASDGMREILVAFITPAPGQHTYTAQGASAPANSCQAVNISPSLNYITVEDIGPTTRT